MDQSCRSKDHDNYTREQRRLKRVTGCCESRSRSPAVCISDFTRLRVRDSPRRAIVIPSRQPCRAAWSSSRRGCHRTVLLLGCEIPSSWHARTRPKAHYRHGTGPYRFSRNPIYLAFSLFQLGIAIWVNSVWLLATLVGALALNNTAAIPKEEQYLERKCGAQYLEYKASVRRWL